MPGSSVYIHSNLVRIRALGSGNLDIEMLGYNDILTQTLPAVSLVSTQSRERDRLCNFTSQATKVKVSMDAINEWFNINSLIVFIKPSWSSGPLVD